MKKEEEVELGCDFDEEAVLVDEPDDFDGPEMSFLERSGNFFSFGR